MSKAKITKENIVGFLQGNARKLFFDIPGIIPSHIKEQICYRVTIMSEDCIKNKECPCGCAVPAKQYEDRPCENNCYPPLMTEEQWEKFKEAIDLTKEKIALNLSEREHLL